MDLHVFPIPIPPPTSLSIPSVWVFSVHQLKQVGPILRVSGHQVDWTRAQSWPASSLKMEDFQPRVHQRHCEPSELLWQCHLRTGVQRGGFPSWGLIPGGSDGKESACNAGDPGLIPGWGRSPGEGNGNPLQYSCLGNPMDRGAWWGTVHGVANSWTQLRD